MAYKNIVFVKLEKRLLNDHRWYTMTDSAQLIYVKLILLAAETYNKIPKNDEVLKEALRSRLDIVEFRKCVCEIEKNFPKFKQNKHFRYFSEFESKTNYVKPQQFPSNSPAIAKTGADKEKEIEKEIDKEKEKNHPSAGFSKEFIEKAKKAKDTGFNIYELINRFYKDSKLRDKLPEAVLIKILDGFLLRGGKVDDPWPYFMEALKKESIQHHIKEERKFEKDKRGPIHIKELINT